MTQLLRRHDAGLSDWDGGRHFLDRSPKRSRGRDRIVDDGGRGTTTSRAGDARRTEECAFVEQFIVSSWSEYRRQHRDRWTSYDHDNVARVLAMTGSGEPDEEHLFTTDVR
ncbi:hypothetical protein [Gordonia bronchialis]|uniref:hypothetical protein n=1 Tax=Gordonia bronchialis TaxID=2054 RepID=UPI00242C6336|nr:hypothetical protein [Gordonia bronchialis]